MQCCKTLTVVPGACWFLAVGEQHARSQEKPASGTVQVHVSRNLAWADFLRSRMKASVNASKTP